MLSIFSKLERSCRAAGFKCKNLLFFNLPKEVEFKLCINNFKELLKANDSFQALFLIE